MRTSIFFFATAVFAAPIELVGGVVKEVDSAIGSNDVSGLNLRDLIVPDVPASHIVDKVTPVVEGINVDGLVTRGSGQMIGDSGYNGGAASTVGQLTGAGNERRAIGLPDVPASKIVDKVAPIVEGVNADGLVTREVHVPDVSVSGIVGEVTDVVGGIDTGVISRDVVPDVSKVDTIVKGIDAGILSRDILDILPSLNLGSIVSLISEVLTGTLELVSQLTSLLEGLVGDVATLDVDGAFKEVEGILSQILTKVQETANFAGTGLDLTKLNPTLAILSTELETVTGLVQKLIDDGAAGQIVDQVKGELATVTGLVAGLQ